MGGTKSPRKKMKVSRVKLDPIKLLNKLTVPEEKIAILKRRTEQEMLRLYIWTGDEKDILSLNTTLRLCKHLLSYVEDSVHARQQIERAEVTLSDYDSTIETINLDAVRDALEVCFDVWRLVTVEEFLSAVKELRQN